MFGCAERIDPEHPQQASANAVARAFAQLTPARDMLVFACNEGPALRPGSWVTPWVLRGIEEAAAACNLTTRTYVAGQLTSAARRVFPHAWPLHAMAPHLMIELRAAGRRARVPKAWLGCHACVVVPYVYVSERNSWLRATTLDPMQRALRQMAALCDLALTPSVTNDALELLHTCFASLTLVVDATFFAQVSRTTERTPEAVHPVARCLSWSVSTPTPHNLSDNLAFAELFAGRRTAHGFSWHGRARHDPLPALPPAPRQHPARVLRALWTDDRLAGAAPLISGELGRLWATHAHRGAEAS